MEVVALTGTLDAQLIDANWFYSEAVRNVEMFLDVAREIQDSDERKSVNSNWESYCSEFMPVSAGRIRQMNIARQDAKTIETVSGLTPIESEINWMKDIIPIEDRHMMPVVYKFAHQLASGELSRRHIKAVYDVEKELSVTGAVGVGGNSLPPTAIARQAAHKEAIMEADKRYSQHRRGANNRTWHKIQLKLIEDKNGAFHLAFPQSSFASLDGKTITFSEDDNE